MNNSRSKEGVTQEVKPLSEPQRVKAVTKCADGALHVTTYDGQCFTLASTDECFQAFVIYSVLAEL